MNSLKKYCEYLLTFDNKSLYMVRNLLKEFLVDDTILFDTLFNTVSKEYAITVVLRTIISENIQNIEVLSYNHFLRKNKLKKLL